MSVNATTNNFTFTAAVTDIITTSADHGLVTGDGPFYLSNSGGALPTGLAVDTPYWIILVDADEAKLAASYADAIASTPVPVDITGTGTGTHTIHIPTVFKLAPPSGVTYDVARILVTIQDNAAATAGSYGAMSTLANGVQIFHKRSGTGNGNVVKEITDGIPIKSNAHFARISGVDVQTINWGSGDDIVSVRCTFAKAGLPLILHGSHGDTLEFHVNDDHSDLVSEYVMAQGVEKGAITA
jgi:hypothetical protein